MNFKALLAFTVLATAPAVFAHQNLHEIYIDGVSQGPEVCLRQPPSNSPVTDINSTDIRCNVGGLTAKPGVQICSARAGSTITVRWDTSSHPGPITHMLSGPYADINSATGAEWFKIDEANLINGEFANIYMMANGGKYSFKLPANLASGDYLLRSEMLALHAAQTVGGGQFYIGCAHLRITGPGGNCSPKIKLPGAYTATERAIYIPDVYFGFQSTTYRAPGGPVATCTATGGAQPTPTSTVRTTTTPVSSTVRPTTTSPTIRTSSTATPTPTPPVAAVAKYGQCGGIGYTGPTTCVTGSTCVKANDYYSQCL